MTLIQPTGPIDLAGPSRSKRLVTVGDDYAMVSPKGA